MRRVGRPWTGLGCPAPSWRSAGPRNGDVVFLPARIAREENKRDAQSFITLSSTRDKKTSSSETAPHCYTVCVVILTGDPQSLSEERKTFRGSIQIPKNCRSVSRPARRQARPRRPPRAHPARSSPQLPSSRYCIHIHSLVLFSRMPLISTK